MNESTKTPVESAAPKRRALRRFMGFLIVVIVFLVLAWRWMLWMPGESYSGPVATSNDTVAPSSVDPAPESEANPKDDALPESPETVLKTETILKRHVEYLSVALGERNLQHHQQLESAANYIEELLTSYGYDIRRETFEARGLACHNIEAEVKGESKPEEIVIIGAHYDSVIGTPGANDNGSGTAAMLYLASKFKESPSNRTLRFVAWTNEEPPYFQTEEMGSVVYAKGCKKRDEDIVAVLSLETMGYFTDEPNSQHYPSGLSAFYPSTGNFIGFVGNLGSRPLVHQTLKSFRSHTEFPSEGAVLPGALPGVGWSDHWSFWQEGYQGVMITDTAPFRYEHYHEESDTPDKIKFDRMAIVVEGLEKVIAELVETANP